MTDMITIIDVINTGGLIAVLVIAAYFLATGKVLPKNIVDSILQSQQEQCSTQFDNLMSRLDKLTDVLDNVTRDKYETLEKIVRVMTHTILSEYDIQRRNKD